MLLSSEYTVLSSQNHGALKSIVFHSTVHTLSYVHPPRLRHTHIYTRMQTSILYLFAVEGGENSTPTISIVHEKQSPVFPAAPQVLMETTSGGAGSF